MKPIGAPPGGHADQPLPAAHALQELHDAQQRQPRASRQDESGCLQRHSQHILQQQGESDHGGDGL